MVLSKQVRKKQKSPLQWTKQDPDLYKAEAHTQLPDGKTQGLEWEGQRSSSLCRRKQGEDTDSYVTAKGWGMQREFTVGKRTRSQEVVMSPGPLSIWMMLEAPLHQGRTREPKRQLGKFWLSPERTLLGVSYHSSSSSHPFIYSYSGVLTSGVNNLSLILATPNTLPHPPIPSWG